MLKFVQNIFCGIILFAIVLAIIEARPQGAENNQELESIEPELEDVRSGSYYDVPAQPLYPNTPIDRLQMMISQYRPNAYFRAPAWSMNDLIRVPESKRQVRYRQCYFNPISCFKK